jgi:hypothetical protein
MKTLLVILLIAVIVILWVRSTIKSDWRIKIAELKTEKSFNMPEDEEIRRGIHEMFNLMPNKLEAMEGYLGVMKNSVENLTKVAKTSNHFSQVYRMARNVRILEEEIAKGVKNEKTKI